MAGSPRWRDSPHPQRRRLCPRVAAAEQPPEGVQLLVATTPAPAQRRWFRQQAWDAVVLDEGQFIKNPASQVATVARALPSRHRLVLTGTPIENRLTDLWSLFAFAQPGLLGTQAAFCRQYDEDDPRGAGAAAPARAPLSVAAHQGPGRA